jgi:molecular chaperone HtpG
MAIFRSAMAEEKTTHRFEAEVEQVLRLVIESLYSNREVFLRELVSNAADALDKLRFRAVTEPELKDEASQLRIRIIPDREAGTLTVWDDGVGMTKDELVSHLGTIAKSGTRELVQKLQEAKEAKEAGGLDVIGQFGVGFYSAYLVADRVEVISRAAGSDEAHRWTSEGKHEFSVEPAEREVHGTSVVLHLGEAHREFLDPVRIRQLVERYSDYLSWPIELKTTKKEGDSYVDAFEKINQGTALWQRPRSEVEDEQYRELYHHLTGDWEKPLAWRHFKLEGMQQFAGIVFVPSRAPMTLWMPDATHGMRLYVKRVFIMDDAEELLPKWLRFVRGVVDSEDLPLNVSRELLQDSRVVRTIRKQVVKQTLDLLKEMAEERPEDYETFWNAFGPVLKEGLHMEPDQAEALAPLLRFQSSAVEGLTSLAEAKERMKEGQKALYYVLGESRKQAERSPHIEGLKKKGYEVLYLVDPVDPFAVMALNEFDGVPLKSASDAGLEVEGEGEGVDEERESELRDLRERFRVKLQDQVSEVRISRRLTDSPVCLVIPQGGMQPHVERILRAAQQDLPAQKRILEINPDHPVIENLRALLEKAEAVERVDEWIELLYDQARIAEGSPIDDPAEFNRRITSLLKDASERLVPPS